MLHELIQHPDQTVSAVARRVNVPPAVATQYLRALNARGLLQARRAGKWEYYRPSPDKSIPGAASLLKALEETFATEEQPIEVIFRHVTAFTHPRRLVIIRALQPRGLTKAALRIRTGISQSALTRHLAKLLDRGFVIVDGFTWRCTRPKGRLAKILLYLARTQ